MSDFINFIKSLRKLSLSEKAFFKVLDNYVTKKETKAVEKLLKQNVIEVSIFEENLSELIKIKEKLPLIKFKKNSSVEKETVTHINEINKKIQDKFNRKLFKIISKNPEIFLGLIAPNIVGMQLTKQAASLLLFSKEPFHLLLLGDPGTGKTDILRSIHELSLISSFGLGSGTSGVGLAVTVKGSEVKKGLLPLADKGICCIDELNLMKEDSRASLYNAMEKGFVTYDKSGTHARFSAKVRVAATANPNGDKFKGNDVTSLRKQLPFDSALLTRFHLVFLIRKPSLKEFKEITKKIIRGTKINVTESTSQIIQSYVKEANNLNVYFPETFEKNIVDFVEELKLREDNFLSEISPRLIIGIIRMAKAAARMEMRDKVTRQDIELVKELVLGSFTKGITGK